MDRGHKFNPVADLATGVQVGFRGSAFDVGTEAFPAGRQPLQRGSDQARLQGRPGARRRRDLRQPARGALSLSRSSVWLTPRMAEQ